MAHHEHHGTVPTFFERLPNEILLEILSYMNHVHAVVAFSKLNSRFQNLLANWCHTFDLTSVNKTHFDIVLQECRTNRWHSLKLSDHEHTLGQINYLLSNYNFHEKLLELRRLSITKLTTYYDYPLFVQIRSLPNLLSLEIDLSSECHIPRVELPNLKKLRVISSSSTDWLQYCPSLERVECILPGRCFRQEPLIWPKTIKYLKIIYSNHLHLPFIQRSLVNLCTLCDLEIYQTKPGGTIHNGAEWTEIINASLPSLTHFKFYFQSLCREDHLNQLPTLVASFSTDFYKSKMYVVVRCDVSARHEIPIWDADYGNINDHMRHVILYTCPFSYEEFTVFKLYSKRKISDWSRNTMENSNMVTCTQMKTLLFKHYSPPDSMFYRSSITNLIIHTPFDSLVWAHSLTKVEKLTLGDGAVLSLEDFSTLLNHIPQLHSLNMKKRMLKVLTNNWTDTCVCRRLSKMIRSLKCQSLKEPSQCFERNELEKMLPIFASQCQHLSLGIHSHINTLDFILRRMPHLHSLHVYIPRRDTTPINMEWLEKQDTRFNRTNCVITTVKHDLYLWLG